jgi:ribosomal protein S3
MAEPTLLSTIIERQVQQSLMAHVARTADMVADELAHELLRDPAFRDAYRELIRVAFNKALLALQDPPPT